VRRVLPALSAAALLAVVFALAGRIEGGDLTPGAAADGVPPMITEVSVANGGTLADEDGDHPAWVELHNPSSSPLALDGYRLGSDVREPSGWDLPDVELAADDHLVVFASGKDRRDEEAHADFTLPRSGGELVLLDGDRVVDQVDVPETARNVSLIRHPAEPTVWCVTTAPTPGASNTDDCRPPVLAGPPRFSEPGGVHASPVTLDLEADPAAGPILYTLDGSYPDPVTNGDRTHVHEGPITIGPGGEVADGEGRELGDHDPITPIETIPDQPEGPEEPVQAATVVRARTVNGRDTAETYFVGQDMHRAELPLLSLALDPGFLFDHETGLYVPGVVHERWREGPAYDPDLPRWEIPANYMRRGRTWERPPADDLHRAAVLALCEPGADCAYTQHLGVRIHGGATRAFRQKSLRLYARNDYGERTIEYPMFGEAAPDDHRRLMLRNSGNDWPRTMFLDGYLQTLISHLPLETQAFRPAVLFLNGEYWGIHNLRERYDRHHLEAVHGVDPDQVIRLDPSLMIDDGRPGDEASFTQVLELLRDEDPASPEVLAEVEAAVDLDDLIEYLVVQLFTGNTDWPGGNLGMWRVRDADRPDDAAPASIEEGGATAGTDRGPGGRDVTDGRWRWLTYDLDHAGNNELDVGFDNLERVLSLAPAPDEGLTVGSGIPWLVSRLLENPEFEQRLLRTFGEQLDTSFRPERSVPMIDELEELIEDEIELHIERWRPHRDVDHWREQVEDLRRFMRQRPERVRQQLVETFELAGTATVELRHDPDAGSMQMGSVPVDRATPGIADPAAWRTEVFQGVPTVVTATPVDGGGLDGWLVERARPDGSWEPVEQGDGWRRSVDAGPADGAQAIELVAEDELRVTPRFTD
jgi:hypothetical protein